MYRKRKSCQRKSSTYYLENWKNDMTRDQNMKGRKRGELWDIMFAKVGGDL